MFGTRLLLCALTCAQAQVVIEKVAGVDRHSGEYAWEMGMHSPGTAWDAQGNAYFGAFNRVWKIHPDGIAEVIGGTGEAGTLDGATADLDRYSGEGGPATQAQFVFPGGVQRDASGQIYFMANNRILRIGTDGTIKTVAGNGLYLNEGMAIEGRVESVSINPGKFAVDPAGMAYFYDFWLVRKVDLAGSITVIAVAETCPYPCAGPRSPPEVAPGTPRLYLISDIDINPKNGDVYITEKTAARTVVIHKLLSGGTLTRIREIPDPDLLFVDMAVDKDGNIFIARSGESGAIVQKLDGNLSFPATLPVERYRYVLLLNPEGRVVYVNGMTVRFAEDGSVMRAYPDGEMHPSPDGTPALETRILGSSGYPALAVNHAGEIYFTEPSTCGVRKIDRQKRLQTVLNLTSCTQYPDFGSMAVGPDNRLWVMGYRRAWVVGTGGDVSEMMLPPEISGSAIAVDSRGRLYANGVRLEPDGSVRRICNCSGLGTDAAGNIYFSDEQGVYRAEDDGSTNKILSGDNFAGGKFVIDSLGQFGRGPAIPGTYPRDVAIASTGDIYVLVDPYPFDKASLLEVYKRTAVQPRAKPLISVAGVVNGASYAGNAVSPGELVSIFGDNFGLTGLQLTQVVNNHLPTKLGPVKVTFNDIEGAITAGTPKQINVFVPSSVESSTNVKIKVFVDDVVSEEISLPVVDTMFGLSTLDASGRGQGAILNANGTVNSRANPEKAGSLIVLFGTGEGKVYPDAGIGAVNLAPPYPKAIKPLSVRIGGQPAEIVFAGGAPTLAQGVYQINARIPVSTPPGDATVEVVAEGGQTSKPVTVAVQ